MKYFINAARDLAYEAHAKDKDKSGRPYREHLLAVANGVRLLGGSDHAVAAAYLHDIVEDHPETMSHLRLINLGFPHQVVKAVEAVSKRSHEEQTIYLARVIAAGQDAMHVKLSDLLNNTRHDRIAHVRKTLGDATADRLLKKYRPSIARLMLELSLIVDVDTQHKLATKPLGSATGNPAHSTSARLFNSDTLLTDDWPIGWPAPIQRRAGNGSYLLRDGSSRNVSGSLLVYTKNTWQSRRRKDPKWTPATERQHTDGPRRQGPNGEGQDAAPAV